MANLKALIEVAHFIASGEVSKDKFLATVSLTFAEKLFFDKQICIERELNTPWPQLLVSSSQFEEVVSRIFTPPTSP